MNKTRLLFSVLALLVWGGGHAAYAGVAVVPGKWIVELESPPALEYEGRTDLALQSADSSARTGAAPLSATAPHRSEEHTSELQSRGHLVCRLLLEKKKTSTAVTQYSGKYSVMHG